MITSLEVDQESCIGCGYCIEICPEVFTWGPERKALVYNFEGCKSCDCISAIENCPVKAISVEGGSYEKV
ncbi:ferredoxin [Thermodesulfobacterium commune]|uniref:Ferredoxin n=2 Tax=Thermodesulfobacterium commune TaxID=1741 RepID=A0A075WZF2_9BACT|nr:ferredoxin [Thermodesulfobacterium commune]AIH04047.1 hypothetical protein HL41_04270 [Thermodesulfobacterium commune DSM 2178]HAA83288.1 ferredoxin [Thermodesulfobacterium commune]